MVITEDKIYEILENVKDPEIPVLSVRDMGIVRGIEISDDQVTVKITPTYSGCPAMYEIRKDIVAELKKEGISPVKIETVLSPPWTTDWLSDEAKQKLKDFGIAPPEDSAGDDFLKVIEPQKSVTCPYCDSRETELKAEYSSTACKSLYFCNECNQPFEHFKCH